MNLLSLVNIDLRTLDAFIGDFNGDGMLTLADYTAAADNNFVVSNVFTTVSDVDSKLVKNFDPQESLPNGYYWDANYSLTEYNWDSQDPLSTPYYSQKTASIFC